MTQDSQSLPWLASPEESALVQLLRALPGTPGAPNPAFETSWDSVPDPRALLNLAQAHGLVGALSAALSALDRDPAWAAEAGRARAEARLRHAWIRAALTEASRALDTAGVTHLVLKGPTLAEAIYPDPGQRISHDLDLLVAPGDLDLALSALCHLGYLAEEGPHADYAREHHVHLHLARADRPLIELHFRAFRGFGIELAAGPLLARSLSAPTPDEIAPKEAGAPQPAPGQPARGGLRVLEPHDRFLYLALHASGHLFERLSWLYDLKLLLGATTLDPALIAARAESLGARAALALTCAALRELNTQGPTLAGLRRLLPEPRRLGAAARIRRAHQRGPRDTPRATLERVAFQALLAPSPAAGARFLSHHLGRIARRRFQRHLPALAPPDWAG